MEQINSNHKQSVDYQIMKDAITYLNFNSYLLFEKELKNSSNYVSRFVPSTNDDSNMCIEIKRTDMDASGRIFNTMNQRCNCECHISHLIMCRHEIVLHKKFDIKFFDIMHHYRPSVTMSFNKGPDIEYNKQTSALTEIFDAIFDGDQSQIDYIDNETCHQSQLHSTQKNDTNSVNQHEFTSDINQNNNNNWVKHAEEQSKVTNSLLNEPEFLNHNNLKNVNNEIFNYYQKANTITKQSISSLLILIRDFAKTNGNLNNQHELNQNDKLLQENQLQNIIQSYNMSFLTDNTTFDSTNVIVPDQNINKCRSKNRKMPVHELIQRKKSKSSTINQHTTLSQDSVGLPNTYIKGRRRVVAESKCSFCSTTGHKIRTCPVLANYKVLYKVIPQKQMYEYIEYLEKHVPILDPDDAIEVKFSALLAQDHNHLIIHKEVYAKIKSATNSYSTMEMKEMMFTVSIISMHNASILQDKIVVNGGEISTYIHNQINKKQYKYLFDGTKIEGMYSSKYHQRQIYNEQNLLLSQNSNDLNQIIFSQASNSQRFGGDPPQEGDYFQM